MSKRRFSRAGRLLVAAALTVTSTAAVVAITESPALANEYYNSIHEADAANKDWMSRVPGDKSIAALSVPGTHETLALCGYYEVSNFCDPVSTDISKTQQDFGFGRPTLRKQLDGGIRSIDIRVRVSKDSNGLSFTIHHAVYYQQANFDDVLLELRDFLSAHPREAVLLNLKYECENSGPSTCHDADGYESDAWRLKVLRGYLEGKRYTGDGDESHPATDYGDLFWGPSVTGTKDAPTPKLGDIRGKVVLATLRGDKGGYFGGYGLDQLTEAGSQEGQNNEYVQDEYSVPVIQDIAKKWEKVRTMLRRTNGVYDANRGEQGRPYKPDAVYMNYTSGTGIFPANVAGGLPGVNGVNEFLIQCLHGTNGRCPEFYPERPDNFSGRETMDRTGIIMMDFPGGGLVNSIIARNPFGDDPWDNGGVGNPMEDHPGGDDGGPRPSSMAAAASDCRPEGMVPTANVATPYCDVYQGDGREWLGNGRPRRVVAYFNGGRTGADGTPHYLVKNIPWSKVTHINYAFAAVQNNRIAVDAAATQMQWPGEVGAEMDGSLPYKGHFNLLTKYKRLHPRVKTLISVGGWAGSTGFYAMTTNADGSVNQGGINTFAGSVVDFLRTYGFNGVDIDFEYPTVLDDSGNPSDWAVSNPRRKGLPQAYTALMKTLRENLDRASAADGHYYLLTSASSASGYLVRGMANQQALRYQDFTNLMAYDYHGTWNDVVGPNATLYDDHKDPELADLYSTPEYGGIGYFNTDWAMKYMRGQMQAGRVNIGVPYYTRGWKNVTGGTNGMWGTSTKTDCEPGTGIKRPCGDGAIGIDNIWHDETSNGGELGSGTNPLWHAENLKRNVMPRYAPNVGLDPDTDANDRISGTYTRHWDDTTKTSWLWNSSKKVFLSTEEEQSIDAVAALVRSTGAGGVMMWELGGDYQCPATVDADHPCGMGYTLTTKLNQAMGNAGAYGASRNTGSTARVPSQTANLTVDFVDYPNQTANLWPLTPTVRLTNNTGRTLGGGKDTTISFDIPAATSPLVKDGNWQTGAQGGQWKVTSGSTFHRVTTTLDYCQIIPAGQKLDLPIIYYLPITGPVNTTVSVGGTSFAPVTDNWRGLSAGTPAAGGCNAPNWSSTKVYDPSTQTVENTTVKYNGKVWKAKWWTQNNIPGTGPDSDHEPWKLIGPAS
ncbi:phosphatidylinositol-specific phospholipase C domain-containing protein [Mangrovihabitans endophyticus]|uniref:1-phosphatidylinositol phosphodiesterase n=1 Tax=Mangrovihabitans endophyticus TaxID=1751298 RepID=A0A8J3FM58_9ACTN|nr:phosphatidylinositol-specific phospholipase C domain-containing protein [Mangrovihabitans endophyticus]GGK73431.1 hypothetical protein GCM10012284_04130 [Mangrovihabitans endophyticus]